MASAVSDTAPTNLSGISQMICLEYMMSQRILELGIGMRMKQGDYCLLRGFMIQLALEILMRDRFDVKTLLELKIPGTSFKSNLLTCG
ncbi:hypothetical protein P8452_18283 [Trifolium repens]|nr:hypothetical protein P8452_18283 [Trifolium repens]